MEIKIIHSSYGCWSYFLAIYHSCLCCCHLVLLLQLSGKTPILIEPNPPSPSLPLPEKLNTEVLKKINELHESLYLHDFQTPWSACYPLLCNDHPRLFFFSLLSLPAPKFVWYFQERKRNYLMKSSSIYDTEFTCFTTCKAMFFCFFLLQWRKFLSDTKGPSTHLFFLKISPDHLISLYPVSLNPISISNPFSEHSKCFGISYLLKMFSWTWYLGYSPLSSLQTKFIKWAVYIYSLFLPSHSFFIPILSLFKSSLLAMPLPRKTENIPTKFTSHLFLAKCNTISLVLILVDLTPVLKPVAYSFLKISSPVFCDPPAYFPASLITPFYILILVLFQSIGLYTWKTKVKT